MNNKNHTPGAVRLALIFASFFLSIVSAAYFQNLALGIATYFGIVTIFDILARYVFRIKSSRFCDPEQVIQDQEVTLEQLDRYFDSRVIIRLISSGAALATAGIYYLLSWKSIEAFCIAYITSTIFGIFFVRYKTDIVRPILVKRDDRYIGESLPAKAGSFI